MKLLTKNSPIIWGSIVFIILFLLLGILVFNRFQFLSEQEEKEKANEIFRIHSRLESVLQDAEVAVYSMKHDYLHGTIEEDFEFYAKDLIRSKNISAVEIVEKGILTKIYPLKGNEIALGHNILTNKIAKDEAFYTIEKKELYFAGPHKLTQGGTAIIGRLPIYKNGEFIAFVAVLIKDSVFYNCLSPRNPNFEYAISKFFPKKKTEQFLIGSKNISTLKHTSTETIDGGNWKIYVANRDGVYNVFLLIIGILCLFVALLGACFVYYILKQPIVLQQTLDKKTADLLKREEYYQTLFDEASDAIIIYDLNLNILDLNESALKLLESTREECLNQSILKFNPKEELLNNPIRMDLLLSGKHIIRDRIIVTPSGERKIIEVNIKRVSGDRFISINRDKTQVRKLYRRLETIREEECTRISRELHDVLGQELVVVKLYMSRLYEQIKGGNESTTDKMLSIMEMMDNSIQTTRRISRELRPRILDEMGIIEAIKWQGHEFEKNTGVQLNFQCNIEKVDMDSSVSNNLFRIYQECLTNIMKHAGATEVKTVIEIEGNYLIMSIQDNGKGFEIDQLEHQEGVGIIGLKERVQIFKGTFRLISKPGKGTKTIITLPLS